MGRTVLNKHKRKKRLFEVTVTETTVETWEVKAESEEEARISYNQGEKTSSDTLVQVSDSWELEDYPSFSPFPSNSQCTNISKPSVIASSNFPSPSFMQYRDGISLVTTCLPSISKRLPSSFLELYLPLTSILVGRFLF